MCSEQFIKSWKETWSCSERLSNLPKSTPGNFNRNWTTVLSYSAHRYDTQRTKIRFWWTHLLIIVQWLSSVDQLLVAIKLSLRTERISLWTFKKHKYLHNGVVEKTDTIVERFDRNLTLRFSKLRTFFSNKLKTVLVRSLFSICAVICMEDCDEALGIISSLVRVTSRLCSVPCAPSLVPWRHPLYSQGVRPLR